VNKFYLLFVFIFVFSSCTMFNKDPKRNITFDKIDTVFNSDEEGRCLIRIADREKDNKVQFCYYVGMDFSYFFKSWEVYCGSPRDAYNREMWQGVPLGMVCK
jgi:hypothetical protein